MATTQKGIYYPNDYTKVADVPSDMQELAESVDAVIDDINNDINLANRNLANVIQLAMTNQKNINTEHETNTQQDKDIEALQTENEELKAENERLNQDLNALPSNTAEGEYITLTDSADSRFNKFKVIGKSTQKTRSGKNMINVLKSTTTVSGVDFTNNEDGSITINGTATANAYFNINNSDKNNRNFFTLEKNQNYGLYLGNSAEGLSMICRSSTKNYALLTLPKNQNERVQQYTDETDEECYAYLAVQSGTTINNLTVYPMIVHGTEIGDYEVYGAMPSPEFKSDIQNVTGNVDIIVANSNLFGKGFSTPKTDTSFWHTVGVGFTPLEDGWGRLELDNSESSSTGYMNAWSRMSNFLNVIKTSTKYKIVVEWRNLEIESNVNSNYLCICGNNNQEAFKAVVNLYYSTLTTTNKATFTVTTKDNIKPLPFLLRTFISVRAGERLSLEVRISIQSVDTNADYEDGKYQEFEFPLEEGQKLYEGSYLADDGIHHKRKQFVVDGTETIYNASLMTDKDTVSFNLNKPGAVGPYYGESPIRFCNIYGEDYIKEWGYFSDNPGSLGVGSTTNQLRFVIDNSFIALVDNSDQEANQEKVANWLKDNNIVVEEEVDEYVEAYTDEQKQVYDELVKTAKTYKTVTNIFSTNEVSPKFEIEYRQDIKSLINNVSQAVLNNA